MILPKIVVDRDLLSLDRHYYNLYVDEKGIRAGFIWRTGNTFRTPFSNIMDFFMNRKYSGMSADEILNEDERNFAFTFDDVQGIVFEENHKVVEIQTNSENMRIIFRSIKHYDSFIAKLKTEVSDKMYERDVEVKPSHEQGYN